LAKNYTTRISIYAGEIASNYDIDIAELKELDEESAGSDVELIITELDKLNIEFYADKKLIKNISIAN
jgi:hypothetical protein